jgi:hypothetical protein
MVVMLWNQESFIDRHAGGNIYIYIYSNNRAQGGEGDYIYIYYIATPGYEGDI